MMMCAQPQRVKQREIKDLAKSQGSIYIFYCFFLLRMLRGKYRQRKRKCRDAVDKSEERQRTETAVYVLISAKDNPKTMQKVDR